MFDNQVELSKHNQGTEQSSSGHERACIPTYLCDWCNARFKTVFDLAEHIRGATRASSARGKECQLDPIDPSSRLLQFNDEAESTPEVKVAEQDPSEKEGEPARDDEPHKHTYMCETTDEDESEDAQYVLRRTVDESRKDEKKDVTFGSGTSKDVEAREENSPGTIRKRDVELPNDMPEGRMHDGIPNTIVLSLADNFKNAASIQLPGTLSSGSNTRSFVTARTSSIASYRTAPSFRRSIAPTFNSYEALIEQDIVLPTMDLASLQSMFVSQKDADFEQQILSEASNKLKIDMVASDRSKIRSIMFCHKRNLLNSDHVSLASIGWEISEAVGDICKLTPFNKDDDWRKYKSAVARHVLDFTISVCNLEYLANNIENYYFQFSNGELEEKKLPVFSSEWLDYLRSRGLIADPRDELDWSGRGQHIEYESTDFIPLIVEKTLGYSNTAIVESVKCRRIRLARKKIRCTRRLKKEDAILEVEHLHRLQHFHILRVVGTYTLKKDLAILLYPATPWNLEEFMEELLDPQSSVNADVLVNGKWRERAGNLALRRFFGCLASSLAFIHEMNVKHMDIKPKNLLVRRYGTFKIYIADFGIARGYKSSADAETDTPVPFTRTYAAPEVILQDTRGFSADRFSLGCVFMEMMATLVSKPSFDERQRLSDLLASSKFGDASYHANLHAVQEWYEEVFILNHSKDREFLPQDLLDLVPRMIQAAPDQRPSAVELSRKLVSLCCSACDSGPESFEAAGPMWS